MMRTVVYAERSVERIEVKAVKAKRTTKTKHVVALTLKVILLRNQSRAKAAQAAQVTLTMIQAMSVVGGALQ